MRPRDEGPDVLAVALIAITIATLVIGIGKSVFFSQPAPQHVQRVTKGDIGYGN